ncbi:phosphoprotein ECPP44-like [Forsythia ovata]|uniref:Phosphoprotein ECPP44-like n=1 Tax=Forsythia ovata TaxID=205694 RepID=A0ABD1QL19_9LAMI
MAEQYPQGLANNTCTVPPPETKERGYLDTARGSKEGQKHTLIDELQHSHCHSSSSSEEEVYEGGERKKKKGQKEAIKDKISGDSGEETEHKDTCIPVEKCNEEASVETAHPEEKKGFLEKIKEKLPGQHKKTEEGTETPDVYEHSPGSDTKEKKGIMDKIKEKSPGHHNEKED